MYADVEVAVRLKLFNETMTKITPFYFEKGSVNQKVAKKSVLYTFMTSYT